MEIRKKIKKSTALTIATASILITALTMAYFTSSDAVTNRFTSGSPSVAIAEPKWDSGGFEKAQKSAPGMKIDKDPRGVNNGDTDMYIRIRMIIRGNVAKPEDIVKAIQTNGVQLVKNVPVNENYSNNPEFIGKQITENKEYLFYYISSDGKMKSVSPSDETAVLFDHIEIPVYKPDYQGTFDKNYSIELTAEGLPVASFNDVPDITEFEAAISS